MKKLSFIGLFFIIFVLTSNAQGVYSKQSLEKDSKQALNLHLEKAKKQKKTGLVMTIAGTVGCVVGALSLSGDTPEVAVVGSLLALGGMWTTIVGLPILITGSTRVKRVKTAINNKQGLSLNIAPGFVYNNNTENFYPGLTLKARF